MSKYKKGVLGLKKTIDSCLENGIFQNIGEYSLNIARMINILHAKIMCNIVKYKLNVYKTSTKKISYLIVKYYTKYQFSESVFKIENMSL